MSRSFWCFARGSEVAGWEAICVDLDIAVEGRTFEEVKSLLDSAIRSYVVDAHALGQSDYQRLMARRAPWYIRAKCWARIILSSMLPEKNTDELKAGFELPCPA